MITEAELRRQAARWQVDPMVVDLDYSLSWFLAALYNNEDAAERLVFKGGTCLRKCYFPEYRFSEDLDFTARRYLTPETLLDWIAKATRWASNHDGPDFAAASPRFEVVADEYSSESYQVRIYYRGPLRWGGSPRAIRLDVTRQESLLLPIASRSLIHPYSDAGGLALATIPCYALDEVLAEKIRAAGGQRRFAVSRDLYDIHTLLQHGASVTNAISLLPKKFAARGLTLELLDVDHMLNRRTEFERDWERRLRYLVPDRDAVAFETAWQSAVMALQTAQQIVRSS